MLRPAFEVFRTYKNSCALRAEQMSGQFYTFYVEVCIFLSQNALKKEKTFQDPLPTRKLSYLNISIFSFL